MVMQGRYEPAMGSADSTACSEEETKKNERR